MTSTEKPLWQAVLDSLLPSQSPLSEPTGRDRPLVESLFVELYVLRERPSVNEMRDYLEAAGVPDLSWRRGILRVWRDRLAHPTRTPRKITGWLYPFVIPERLADELGLRPVPDRLADAAKAAAEHYMRCAATDPAADETREAAELHTITANAVRLWALTRDRVDGVTWPSVIKRPGGRDTLFEYATRTGRARGEARLDAYRRELAEAEAREQESVDIE